MPLESSKTVAPEWHGSLIETNHPEILTRITDTRLRLEAQLLPSVEARLDDSGQFVLLKVQGVEDFECRLTINPDTSFRQTIEGPLPRIIRIPPHFGEILVERHESHLSPDRQGPCSNFKWWINLDHQQEKLAKPLLMDASELQEIVLVEGERRTRFVRTGDHNAMMWVEQGSFPLRPSAVRRRFASSEGVDYLETNDAGILRLIPTEALPGDNLYFVEPYPLQNGVLLQPIPTNLNSYGPRGDAPSTTNEYQFCYDNGLTTFARVHGLANAFPPNLYVENTPEGKRVVFDGTSLPLPPEGTVLVSAFNMRYQVTEGDLVLEEGSMLVFEQNSGSFRGESWRIYLPGLRNAGGFVLIGPHRPPGADKWDEWDHVYLSWEGNDYPSEVARVIATHPAFRTIKIIDVTDGHSRDEKIFERNVEGNPEEATYKKVHWEMI